MVGRDFSFATAFGWLCEDGVAMTGVSSSFDKSIVSSFILAPDACDDWGG